MPDPYSGCAITYDVLFRSATPTVLDTLNAEAITKDIVLAGMRKVTIGRVTARLPSSGLSVDQLAKQAAEIALRLAALPADGLRNNPQALDAIERLAMGILKEVSSVRAGNSHAVGEVSGMWRIPSRQ